MRTLVIVPTFNDALNLEELTSRLLALDYQLDVAVIDDASPDGTGDLAVGALRALVRMRRPPAA